MKKHICERCNKRRILAYTHNSSKGYSYSAICDKCYNEFDEYNASLKKHFKPIKEIGAKNGIVCYFH